MRPATRYATTDDGVSIAYQVVGEGPQDLVLILPFVSHLDLAWDSPGSSRFLEQLGRLSRVILFDKRGMGLSDPVDVAPTLEVRMEDARAVMDAAGSERATIFGMSEGAPMAVLFAATYPERVTALILWGAMARAAADVDYPWAPPREALVEANEELIAPLWGQGDTIEIFNPSLAGDPRARELQARLERQTASPRRVRRLYEMFLDFDVRDVLALVQAPTRVIHRTGDRIVPVGAGRWLAEQIPGATFVELPGSDHAPWVGDADSVLAEVEEMLTGTRPPPVPERVLATVVFTDIVGSTELAAELGDAEWRRVLEAHRRMVRSEIEEFRGREVNTTGDGFLVTFDGPARAIRFAGAVTERVEPTRIELRFGVHAGECELLGDDVGGIAVHIASRICDLSQPGETLISRTVKDLAAGAGIGFEPRGSHRLKGVPDEWELFAITSAGAY
ncbi:MAG TPA: adenylate/guanylate cyclase domain-containing protein [Solirubrobacterales bacterium]|nr:adenylate/guanylate cyclase domain-containing protein [Solirubrobacterales bacterium]